MTATATATATATTTPTSTATGTNVDYPRIHGTLLLLPRTHHARFRDFDVRSRDTDQALHRRLCFVQSARPRPRRHQDE